MTNNSGEKEQKTAATATVSGADSNEYRRRKTQLCAKKPYLLLSETLVLGGFLFVRDFDALFISFVTPGTEIAEQGIATVGTYMRCRHHTHSTRVSKGARFVRELFCVVSNMNYVLQQHEKETKTFSAFLTFY